jgi:hypothetical protein
LVILPLAGALSPWNIDSLRTTITFSGELEISAESGDSRMDQIEAKIYIVPQDTENQRATLLSASPGGYSIETDEYGNRFMLFRWEGPTEKTLTYEAKWDVETNQFTSAITELGSLGDSVPKSIEPFMQLGNLSMWTGAIKNKAREITNRSNSVFEAVGNLTNWVYWNTEYDREYWQDTYPAREVFVQARGVCDEFTNLFMSFVRSLGIPARYVDGLVFSGESWDMHSWAEVYLGDRWIPLDPTYNEIGFVDSTHIVIKRSPTRQPPNMLSWMGVGMKARFGRDSKEIEVESAATNLTLLLVDLGLSSERVESNTVVDVTAGLESLANSNIFATCRLNMPEEMMLLDHEEKSVLIPPHGVGAIRWRVLTPSDLDKNWIYKMPIEVGCFPKANQTASLTVDPKYSADAIPAARIEDVTMLDEGSVRLTTRNTGSKDLKELRITACLRDGDEICQNSTIRDFRASETRVTTLTGFKLLEKEWLVINITSSDFNVGSYRASVSGVQELAPLQVIQQPGPPTPERLELQQNPLAVILMVAIILTVILSIAVSVVKHH